MLASAGILLLPIAGTEEPSPCVFDDDHHQLRLIKSCQNATYITCKIGGKIEEKWIN